MIKQKLNFDVEINNEPSEEAIQLFNQQINLYFKKYIIEKLNSKDVNQVSFNQNHILS